MKQYFALVLFLFTLLPLNAQDKSGIGRWITAFPEGQTDIAGCRITQTVIEPSGAMIVVDRRGLPVRISLLRPVSYPALAARLALVVNTVLADLAGERWTITVKECEIDIGLKDDMTVTLAIGTFRFRLNQETTIELANRLEAAPVFRHRSADDSFAFSLRFRGIDPGTGSGDAFRGWQEFTSRLRSWYLQGLKTNNQEMLSLVQETKVMAAETDLNLPPVEALNPRTGVQVTYLMPCLLNVDAQLDNFYFSPGVFNMLLADLSVSWRNLGDPSWLVKPYCITVSFGGFCEVNAGVLFGADLSPAVWPTGPLSFILAFGPAVRVEFAAMIPKIVDDRYAGDLFGIGIELLTVFNVPYFFADYEYDFFLTQFVNLVFHLLPAPGNTAAAAVGGALVLGFNFSINTLNYEDAGDIQLGKFGITLGARMLLDLAGAPAAGGTTVKN